ncbi:IS1634 family transposase [Ferrimicrobium acidiphilum]|uniref:IS1634 family transposase n=1 Tax=Ferrimicrobium acidiphilum TaxID=121039 RepID=UPI0023F3C546|nr:IS1634 family transposase [Ferrimicrobium acidiphilum]
MFIRAKETKNRITGTTYVKHQLVRSVRYGDKVRQEIVMELPGLDIEKADFKKLANVLTLRLAGRESLLEADDKIRTAADQMMENYQLIRDLRPVKADEPTLTPVDLGSVGLRDVRSLGKELVATSFYERLGINEALIGLSQKEQALAKAIICTRLIGPGSDLATHRYLRDTSALGELIEATSGIDVTSFGKDAIYEVTDTIYEQKDSIEAHLARSTQRLYPGGRLLLFDLTNVYLEGSALGNELAAYGHSKEKRNDCALISLALLVDDRGFPVYSHMYAGNQSEPATLSDVLDTLDVRTKDTLFVAEHPMVVMDRGIATTANIALLVERNYPYLVVTRGDSAKVHVDAFKAEMDTFTPIDKADGSQVWVKTLTTRDENADPVSADAVSTDATVTDTVSTDATVTDTASTDTAVTEIAVISLMRAAKERSINEGRTKRYLADLTRLCLAIEAGTYRVPKTVERRIGRLANKHRQVARNYEVNVVLDADGKAASLSYRPKPEAITNTEALYGAYVIETNKEGLSREEIWHLYITLTRVEEAFRALKSDLGLRPVYHQLARRTSAHLFISVLAYHLYGAIAYELSTKSDTRRPSTIFERLATHMRATVTLTDGERKVHHLRVSTTPDPDQRQIFDSLGITDPLPRRAKVVASL